MTSPAEKSCCPLCQAEFVASGEEWDRTEESLRRVNAYWGLKHHMETEHAGVMFHCPRQDGGSEVFHYNTGKPEAYWTKDNSCSYCGSMHEDDLMKAIEAGHTLTPTDKSYKVYVTLPNPDVGKPVRVSSHSGPAFDSTGTPTRDDITAEEAASGRYERVVYGPASPTLHKKFYFGHLSAPNRKKFLELLNAKKIKLAYPGHFYVLPHFITKG